MSKRIGLVAAAVAVPAALVLTSVGIGQAAEHTPSLASAPAGKAAQAAQAVTADHRTAAVKNLDDPAKKEIAMKLVSSAENSSLDWRAQFKYIEDID
ncbi:hypothetical protein AB4212_70240, partial [Streptomyces sp. 2MCAF27]